MPITGQLTVTADASAVSAASAWVRSVGARLKLPETDIYRLDVCVTELVSNIASYGFDNGEGVIELRADAETEESVTVEVSDSGKPFDPLSVPLPEPASSVNEVRIGGMGIRLVRSFADEYRYDRMHDRNRVILSIHRSAKEPASGRVERGVERRREMQPPALPLTRANGNLVTLEERSGRDRRLLGFISRCSLFRNVPYKLLEKLLARCPIRSFADGTVLLRPGEPNEHVALILEGRLLIHFGSPASPDHTEINVGECAGEMSIIDNQPVSAYVIADSHCRLLLIHKNTFLTRILTIPEVARNLVSTFSDRMRSANKRVVERMELSLELTALQRELAFARQIQASMVPDRMTLTPARPGIQCCGFMRPARQVGGDFYDAFYVEANRLAIVMGDVCGKGMPAALFMARTMTLLRSEAMHPTTRAQRRHVLDVVEQTNRQLCASNAANYFVSCFIGLLDVVTGLLTYVNAGLTPPALARGSTNFRLLSEPRDMVAGLFEDAVYTVGEIALPPGSALLLHTDGVTEAENANGEMFGQARLLALLNGERYRSPDAMIDATVEMVGEFVQEHPQSDDLTLLAVLYDPYSEAQLTLAMR
jgi:phosphoserine phosphatase RsbU/P